MGSIRIYYILSIFLIFLSPTPRAYRIHRKHHQNGNNHLRRNAYSKAATGHYNIENVDNDNNDHRIQHVQLSLDQMKEIANPSHDADPWWLHAPIKDIESHQSGESKESEESSESPESRESGPFSDKDQLTAFLLSFFLGFCGAGRLYIGDIAGMFKLCLCVIACCYPCFLFCCFGKRRGNQTVMSFNDLKGCWGRTVSMLEICAYLALIAWIIIDIVLFAMNEIPDSEGLTLY